MVGVDGCHGGWVAVALDGAGFDATFHPTFLDVIEAHRHAACIAVDVPIGLATDRPRACDVAARKLLGKRRSSVFPAPDPRLLDSPSHEAASALSRSLTNKGVQRQAFGIFPKVAEVDRLVTRPLQSWVVECHPEVSFAALAGRPMEHPKDRPEGYEERWALLTAALGITIPTRAEARALVRESAPDDLLDAFAAAWTARRAANGQAGRVPAEVERDQRDRRMEIVY